MMSNIERMLLELKDTSEFMIDLAYSSLIYNNKEIAEEVEELERKMDVLSDDIQEAIINLGKQQPEEIAKMSVIIRMQMAIEDIANAAASIADVVTRGLGDHPVIQMSIQESDVTIEKVVIEESSIMNGRSLADLRLGSHCGMYVIAIKRDGKFIYGPSKDEVLRAGDLLIAKGPDDAADFFIGLADGSEKEL